MSVVVLVYSIFQIVTSLALILFLIHYISYIVGVLVHDFRTNILRPTIDTTQSSSPPSTPQIPSYQLLKSSVSSTSLPLSSTNRKSKTTLSASALSSAKKMPLNTNEARFMKKCWKGGSIEPHPTEKALIVNYQLQVTIYGDPNRPMIEDTKKCQKTIKLDSLTIHTDPAILARKVLEKYDFIHQSHLADVEQIIFYLKNRQEFNPIADILENKMGHRSIYATQRSPARPHTTMSSSLSVAANKKSSRPETTEVSINHIDEYVELLYEEMSERIRGSSMILQVARNPDNLEELEKNEACLSALARVLREDWRKSLDLSTNIIYTFFCFSTYTKFHSVIVQYKIGSLCMDVIEYELRRYDSMRNEIDIRKNLSGSTPISAKASKEKLNNSSEEFLDLMHEERPKEMEPPRRRIPELKQRPKSGNWSSYHGNMTTSLIKSPLLNNSYHEALSSSGNGAHTPDSGMSSSGDMRATSNEELLLDSNDPKVKKEEIDRLNKQLKVFAKKQEQLLRVAFYLLLNMAENVKLEEKMRRKNIVKMLIKSLDRQNIDLLMLITTFLKKLSIVSDNKDDMNELGIIPKLIRLLQSGHVDLIQVTLKLIFNLSFDGNLRRKMIAAGYLPLLVMFINDEKHHGVAIKILYHMSLDDKVKSMFTHTECIQLAIDAIILNLNSKVDLDMIALCINLSLNRRNAQIMVEGSRLHNLMERALKYKDSLLMKLLRNLSQHESIRQHFLQYVNNLASLLTNCQNEAFLVESLGILGNITSADIDYTNIVQEYKLIPWFCNLLNPGSKMDDLVLDAIVYLGTCARDELCALLFCRANVIVSLIELLKAKQEDDEMVLQIIFVFQQILRHESTRDYIIRETESPAYLIDLMHDKNAEIRKVCDYCLDIIASCDNNWAKRIKLEKFRNHNSQWLCMVESQQMQSGSNDVDGDYNDCELDNHDLNNYLRDEYLNGCNLYDSNRSNKDTEDNDSNNSKNPNSPATSIYSCPASRNGNHIDESVYSSLMNSSTKSSQDSGQSERSFMIRSSNTKSFESDLPLGEQLLLA